MRDTTLFQTSSPSEAYTQSYGAPKLQESQPWQFWDSHLGVLGQKAIWMRALWAAVGYTIRGRWWLPPSPGYGESCEFELPVVRPSTKGVLAMH